MLKGRRFSRGTTLLVGGHNVTVMDSTTNSSSDASYSFSASEAESSTESEEYGSGVQTLMNNKNSTLLSHPSNQFGASGSSTEEEEERPKKKKNIASKATPLSCGPHGDKKKEDEAKKDEIECDETISISSKVVSLDSLRKEVPMGSLKPITRNISAPVVVSKEEEEEEVISFSTMNKKEIEAIALQQKAREIPLKATYKTLASMNESELANVAKAEEKRLAAIKGISAQRPEISTKTSSTGIASQLSRLDSESPESYAEIKRVNDIRLTAMKASPQAYKLSSFSDLSEEKKDAIFVSERKRLLSNFKPIDALSPKQLSALASNSTPFSRPVYGVHDEAIHTMDVDKLSMQELQELVKECRLHHVDQKHHEDAADTIILSTGLRNVMPATDPRQTGVTQAKLARKAEPLMMSSKQKQPDIILQSVEKDVLVDFNTLSVEKQKQIRANIALNNQKKHLDSPLVEFHTLPQEKQREIRANMEALNNQNKQQVFTASKSALSSKKEFDLKVGNSILSSKPNVQTLYHNLTTANLAASKSDKQRHHDKYKRSLMKHLKKAHPVYASLLKQHIHRRILDTLLGSKDRNFIFVIPTEALLAIYQQNGAILNLAKLATAYLTILLKEGEDIPSDNTPYSCANLLRDHRVNVRRIDGETIMIDNDMVAKLDPASGGKVYKMVEPAKVEDVTDEKPVAVVAKKEEEEITTESDSSAASTTEESKSEEVSESSETSEATVEDEDESVVIKESEEPKVIASLPAADANALAIVPFVETKIATLKTELSGVFKNSLYNNRKIELLANKMLNTEYNGEKHMASYIDHSQDKKALNSNLYLKTFAYDDLYDKYRTTSSAMTGAEHLTPMDSFTIDGSSSLNYALDKSLDMKEYVVNTKEMKIRKGQLINHFVVLTFKMPKGGDYANLSFTLPDETKGHTDTYMSANENLLLNFKENLLQSIVINTNANDLTRTALAEPSRFSSLVAGKPLSAVHNISVMVPMNDEISARLYEKDLNYAQFLSVVMPLSAPSLFQRAKGFFQDKRNDFKKNFAGHKIMPIYPATEEETDKLVKRIDESMQTSGPKKQLKPGKLVHHATTDEVSFGLAKEYYTPENWEKYLFSRATYRKNKVTNKSYYQYVTVYDHIDSTFDMNEMIDAKKSKPTLTIKLSDPQNKGKKSPFRFNFADQARRPSFGLSEAGGRIRFYRAANEDGSIVFLFEVHATKSNAALQRISVFYLRKTNAAPLKMQEDVAKFIATEAYTYKRLNLAVSSSLLTQRLNKFVSLSELNRVKTDSKEHHAFFVALQKETESYMKAANLNILLADAPSTTLTSEKKKIIESSGYSTPLEEETKHFKSLMLSSFSLGSPLPNNNNTTNAASVSSALVKSEHAKEVLNSVIQEYTTLSNSEAVNTKDVQFALYVDRVRHISNFFKCAFESK